MHFVVVHFVPGLAIMVLFTHFAVALGGWAWLLSQWPHEFDAACILSLVHSAPRLTIRVRFTHFVVALSGWASS